MSAEAERTIAPPRWRRLRDECQRRAQALPPTTRALLWSAAAGLTFSLLNAVTRALTLGMDSFQAAFLRYLFGLLVLLPLVLRGGLAQFWPKNVGGQFLRGGVHTLGMMLWFVALPRISLADMTAIGFTGPIFIMLGAWLFFREPMRWERWLAAAIGFTGVMIVVAPRMSGSGGFYHLMMLASAPVFAASFLMTKALTRYETARVIVLWQAISVTLLTLPLGLMNWQSPTVGQWLGFALCGLLGSGAHYLLTRSYLVADISATQSVKFLELVWAGVLGWMLFSDTPSQSTLIGGAVICASTLWIARRESRQSAPSAA